MVLRTLKFALCASFVALGASATTLTFNSHDDCDTSDVLITAGHGAGSCYILNGPTGSDALVKGGQYSSFWKADFSTLVDYVSVDLGDFGDDDDELFLAAFDETNSLIGVITKAIESTSSSMHTLTLALADISKVYFGVTGDRGNGGIYADNFTYNVQAVPVPASALLFGSALMGLGLIRRKKKA